MSGVFWRQNWWLILGLLALAVVGCRARAVLTPIPEISAPPPAPAHETLYVAAHRLNLRACPGMDCPKVSMVDRNEQVEKLEERDDWVYIRVKKDGRLGYVSARYLSREPVKETPDEIAPPEAPPLGSAPPGPGAPPSAREATRQPPAPKKKIEEILPPEEEEVELPPPPAPAPKKMAEEPRPKKVAPPPAKAAEPPAPAPAPAPAAPPGPDQPKRIRVM